ncbi:hypothetical protein FA15DRAFT_621556 [Coprinopsis marcescibilis]|uniref:F-box domain-containing protein n=1 Tax=Coprinopsis marcescibilis TaxID=230819 RepID=A0A5C3KR49_COPMA|nr:hypothetical protein FA15DRAFT_621556 [Coprinopsis marcescibilis]
MMPASLPDQAAAVTQKPSTERNRRDKERKKIDSCIAEFEQKIRDLRTQRNELSPISQLPAEIICRIFLFCEQIMPWRGSNGQGHWFQLTQVCRYWRAVSLGCAQLWSHIYVNSSPWTKAMVERSKHTPISIESWSGNLNSAAEASLHDILKTHTYRLKSLSLSASSSNSLEKLVAQLRQPAPILHSLTVTNQGYNGVVLEIPVDLFGEGAPSLRQLSLKGSQLSWSSPWLTGLTRLEYSTDTHGRRSQPETPPTPQQFLQALENMPALTHLDLEMNVSNFASTNLEPITLSSLQHLHLKGALSGIAGVLRHLSFPSTTTLNLNGSISSTELSSQLAPNLVSALRSSRSSNRLSPSATDEAPCFRSFHLDVEEGYMIRFQGWFQTLAATSLEALHCEKQPPWLDLRVTSEWGSGGLADPQPFLSSLPLESIKRLYVEGTLSKSDYMPFARLEELECVSITGANANQGFVEFLKADPRWSGEELDGGLGVKPAYLPNLKCVVMDDADFYGGDGIMSVVDFLDCLMMRYELGGALEYLRIWECFNIVENDIKLIEEIVGETHVAWDKTEEMRDPDDDYDEEDDELEYGDYGYSDPEMMLDDYYDVMW